MAPSRYDWKIVDWDVKPQHNQPTNQLSNVSQFSNRKFLSISHIFGFGAKILSSNDTTFVRVILFFEMLPKTISDDHKSLKISMPCDR